MRHWTMQEREQQAKLIQKWKPWKLSTGAKTTEGKETSKMNAQKHGAYNRNTHEIRKLISLCGKSLKQAEKKAIEIDT